ncbi:hypothetical protein [Nocardioides sp. URHA0032]|uniref:hypothetical protein n=1 Tax=Nocardioides sp. URHA0032 TaxID=1380388 RepID=UPI0006858483|nr:hypothetical protein [Nocardioides sp. URHA0032]
MDARDSLDGGTEDTIGSTKPPRPPKPPRDPARTQLALLQVIAVAAIAAAAFTGITAWHTYQDRQQTKTIYCSFYDDSSGSRGDESYDRQQRQLRDELGC